MTDAQIRVFDLETQLSDDDSGTVQRSLCDALEADLRDAKQRINQGLPPDEFREASKYAAALERASVVVEKVWKMEHGQPTA